MLLFPAHRNKGTHFSTNIICAKMNAFAHLDNMIHHFLSFVNVLSESLQEGSKKVANTGLTDMFFRCKMQLVKAKASFREFSQKAQLSFILFSGG